MSKRARAFSAEEYEARLRATRAAMADRGVEALIATDPSNMAWLTGYDGWSFYVHQAVVVTQDGPPLWWGRPMDGAGARVTTELPDDAIFEYADDYVQNPDKHPHSHLAGLLADWGFSTAAIGVELDNYYYSAAAHQALASTLPQARFVDATGLVNWRRLIKSPAEIQLMREAALIVQACHAEIAERIEPGMRRSALIAEVLRRQTLGVEGPDGWIGGDYTAIAPMAASGAEAAAAHLTWDDQPFRRGEATFFEIAGCRRRYHCPQSRSVFLGNPPAEIRKAEAAILYGIDAALGAVAPGAPAEAVETAWRETVARHGFSKTSRIGYSTGLSYPPDWGERTLSIRRGDTTELRPGMVLHLIPALWEKEYGLEITETFLVTENGAEPLCATPRAIVVKP